MEKCNWKHSVTLKQRMVLCLAAFFAAFALQLALNGYQARAVQQVQDDQMGNFNAISRFQGGVESSISILEAYRWENGETEEMLEKLQAACSTSNAWLWRIRSNMDGLQNVSDEQWVLYGAVETTYGSYNTLLEELESYLSSGQEAKASQLYYNKVSVCGGYLSQYTMQLLKASILDAQTTYTEISELGERIALMQIVVVALCVALGCASGLMVMRLLTPVSQMIVASRAISRSQFDTPDIPLPKQPEIGQLAESFNRMKHSMAQQVSTLQEKNEIERELHRQKTEALELQNRMERSRLQQLRSQIDPHFLFNTLNVIQYMHDKYYYEEAEMALIDTDVRRTFATGIAGFSHVIDSLSAIKYAKVKVVRDENGLATGFETEGDFPKYGNDDDRVDGIASELVDTFMSYVKGNHTYRGGIPTTSILTITSNVVYGKNTGSTPDGRKKGEPFAPGANPMHRRDTHGAVASLASVAKLPFSAAQDGISNTFSIVPGALGKEDQIFTGDLEVDLDNI